MRICLILATAVMAVGVLGRPAAAQVEADLLPVGAMAPDFSLVGATQHGILRDPVRLSDYRGNAVVVGFFYEVRTPG